MTDNPVAIRQIQALMIAYQNLTSELVLSASAQGVPTSVLLDFVSRLIAANERTIPPQDAQFLVNTLLELQTDLLEAHRNRPPPADA